MKEIMSVKELVLKLIELNPKVEIKWCIGCNYIESSELPEKIKLPKGFYYNIQNGITNKHNTMNESYICLQVITV